MHKTHLNTRAMRGYPAPTRQRGIMLLESLVAILIFSIGVLGLVALQSKAINLQEDAKYRVQAAYLANLYIGQIWSGNYATACTDYATNTTTGSPYVQWLATVQDTLPGVAANPPTVVLNCGTNPSTIAVTITINWKLPASPTVHSFTTSA